MDKRSSPVPVTSWKSANEQGTGCFYWINIARKTYLILARISSRFLVSQPGVGEMEYWNIYQSVAYSAEGPLCMPVWSFTTCSQIKYLSHLNKKASAGSRPVVVRVHTRVCVWVRVVEMRGVCYQGWLVWSPGWRGCVEPVRMEIWDSPPYLLIHRDWDRPQLIHCAVATEARRGGGLEQAKISTVADLMMQCAALLIYGNK